MARRSRWWLGGAAVALGLGHMSLAVIAFERLSLEALWFAGSGVAIILGGLLNLFAQLARFGTSGRALLGLANLMTLAFFALAWRVVPEPQVMVGLLLFLGLTALSWAGQDLNSSATVAKE